MRNKTIKLQRRKLLAEVPGGLPGLGGGIFRSHVKPENQDLAERQKLAELISTPKTTAAKPGITRSQSLFSPSRDRLTSKGAMSRRLEGKVGNSRQQRLPGSRKQNHWEKSHENYRWELKAFEEGTGP